jgi:hypothetical protein
MTTQALASSFGGTRVPGWAIFGRFRPKVALWAGRKARRLPVAKWCEVRERDKTPKDSCNMRVDSRLQVKDRMVLSGQNRVAMEKYMVGTVPPCCRGGEQRTSRQGHAARRGRLAVGARWH